ncbi:SpoIIE family protein phosphatase [Jatrophihabitans endophyticus]|uniref:SpoIIE family protein phosphatase n=1 Tax=Jatrophihabitans endophyticus TaxID=1206085 RepID=UPI0019E7313C|nr:SpoIIE family protein phosphatase [Jatrophihabitans endophyticus]MBE7188219.1 SpoIIE family protein phosphatase [Jatrophihabitans endophyticus]
MSPDDLTGRGLDLVAPGTPIDLDNCAREPIHIPGSIQPRGVLLVAREPEFALVQASANLPDVLGRDVDAVLGAEIESAIGVGAGQAVRRSAAAFGHLRDRNPVEVEIDVDGRDVPFDAILHRIEGGLLLVEIEAAEGPRPYSFPNTYLAARSAVGDLNRAATLSDLYDITARSVRDLTGFDRVMVYRYDSDYNGEVVAEAKRDDLNSFLGQHYPASDIPAQARALYERNWIRLINDIDYVPTQIVPTLNPVSGNPLDLTFSTLRSVSPIHVEYLQNMGVRASMSISLLRDGKLWGLIACHHYAGPHTPTYAVRAAAEFLGSTLSLRLVDRSVDEELRLRLAAQAVLAKLTSAAMNEAEPLTSSLLGAPDLLDLVPAGGVVVNIQGAYDSRGTVPGEAQMRRIAAWAAGTGDEMVASDSLGESAPELGIDAEIASGVLALTLPDGQFVIWVRPELARSVDWGGDPHNKAIAVREGDSVRLSPRKSFERWREVVRGHAEAWTVDERDVAVELRRHVVESLYSRMQSEVRLAETLQRSLLPPMPRLDGWTITAHYEPAAGGRIGGDWYDAIPLRDGRVAVVLGDVAGHGIGAAGTMAQLRNALRAYLIEGLDPAEALDRLNVFTHTTLPGSFATIGLVRIDTASGVAEGVSAGHPRPFLLSAGGSRLAPQSISPPLGVQGARYTGSEYPLGPGEGLVLYSDGMIERRDEDIETGMARFGALIDRLGDDPTAHEIFASVTRSTITDDATVLAVHRLG